MSTRREVLAGIGAAASTAILGCHATGRDRDFMVSGSILGAAAARGHLLRDGNISGLAPIATIQCDTIIVGAGISGLSAAAALNAAGRSDFIVCELADEPGGNAVGGQNAISRYPWGAHYVPIADITDEPLCRLFAQLGIIRDVRGDGLPIYEETFLCADPDERLFIQGTWQDGFLPTVGLHKTDLAQNKTFLEEVKTWRAAVGRDGLPAFSLPLAKSSADPDIRALDAISFAALLDRKGYTSTPLRWYLDYCCRDDYGAPANAVSAWAGLHYFASRRGRAANASQSDVVTWPEGNSYLARALASGISSRLKTGLVATQVSTAGGKAIIDAFDVRTRTVLRIEAAAAILAVPRHVLSHLAPGLDSPGPAAVHVPWVVANITTSRRPAGTGAPLAWDNVVYGSDLLGYVVADHQTLGMPRDSVVITYYWPLSDRTPVEARRFAQRQTHGDWCAHFLAELYQIHPELRGQVENLDVWVWGHGMICPVPGYCFGDQSGARRAPRPPLFFAHTDLSGISVFEEAFSLGQIAAADRLRWRG
jgi:hypothetical protein